MDIDEYLYIHFYNFGSIDDYMASLPYSSHILKQIFAKNKVTIINSIELSLIENIIKNI